MFICHLLHKSVHFFLQNKSTLKLMTDATDHNSVLYARGKVALSNSHQRHCDIESKKGMSVTIV